MRPSRDDSWPRVLRNTLREYVRLLPPRRRLGDPEGVSFKTMIAWGLGGPTLLVGGLQAIWVEPADPRGWGGGAVGLIWVVTAVRYVLRPATVEGDPTAPGWWGRKVDGGARGRDSDDGEG